MVEWDDAKIPIWAAGAGAGTGVRAGLGAGAGWDGVTNIQRLVAI